MYAGLPLGGPNGGGPKKNPAKAFFIVQLFGEKNRAAGAKFFEKCYLSIYCLLPPATFSDQKQKSAKKNPPADIELSTILYSTRSKKKQNCAAILYSTRSKKTKLRGDSL